MKKVFTFSLIAGFFATPLIAQNPAPFDRIANGIDTVQKIASDSLGRVFVVDKSNEEEVGDNYHTVVYNTRAVEPFEQVSLAETFAPDPIRIYPNPVVNDATIEFPSLDMYYVSIMNIKGETVYDQHELLNSVRIDWLDYPKGLYYVRIMNMNSNQLYSRQVYKQ